MAMIAIFGIPGALIGSYYSTVMQVVDLKIILGFIEIAIALWIIIRIKLEKKTSPPAKKIVEVRNIRFVMPFAGIAIGFISALAGIGGGVILVPFLLYVLDFSYTAAVGTPVPL